MPGKRLNPNLIKTHFSYTATELAKRLGVHKNTVRNWTCAGLTVLPGKPALYHGGSVRAFLAASNASKRAPCPPGTFYCFRCRDRRKPALGMVDYVDRARGAGNLTALCESCGATMNRRARRDALPGIMPGLAVVFVGHGAGGAEKSGPVSPRTRAPAAFAANPNFQTKGRDPSDQAAQGAPTLIVSPPPSPDCALKEQAPS